MCVSARASLGAFFTNLISCIALLVFGNKDLKHYNLFTAIFLTFVSLMQLVDYGIWKDLDCSKGFNKIASIAGLILNFSQPIIAFVLIILILKYTKKGKELYQNKLKPMESGLYKNFSLGSNKLNFLKVINYAYIVVFLYAVIAFLIKGSTNPDLLCTKELNGHLKWSWYTSGISSLDIIKRFYHIIIITIIAFNPKSTFVWLSLGILYSLFAFSKIKFHKNTGEIWCYIVNITALLLLVIQKLFPNFIN